MKWRITYIDEGNEQWDTIPISIENEAPDEVRVQQITGSREERLILEYDEIPTDVSGNSSKHAVE